MTNSIKLTILQRQFIVKTLQILAPARRPAPLAVRAPGSGSAVAAPGRGRPGRRGRLIFHSREIFTVKAVSIASYLPPVRALQHAPPGTHKTTDGRLRVHGLSSSRVSTAYPLAAALATSDRALTRSPRSRGRRLETHTVPTAAPARSPAVPSIAGHSDHDDDTGLC